MCTAKRPINAKAPHDLNLAWKIPKQILKDYKIGKQPQMLVKCGKCYECKKERARNWTYKIWLEALSHKDKCFITLTYRDDKNGTQQVEKEELQKFIKRLRKNEKITNMKYFAAGEYGEKKGRAHYHIIILGWKPDDIKKINGMKSKKNKLMYTSEKVKKLWGKGIVTVQEFAPKEIGYLTLYLNNNDSINFWKNKEPITLKRDTINKVKYKHGINLKYTDKNGNIKYDERKLIKDLSKEELSAYKKDYLKETKEIKLNKQNEFNLYSKNMGFDNYIKKEYWKYDLILDGYTYERPKEFLRKIIENKENYSEEIYTATVYELLSRKEYAEYQIEEIMKKSVNQLRAEERAAYNKNENNKKLFKKIDSIF